MDTPKIPHPDRPPDLTEADLNWGDINLGPVATTALVAAAAGQPVPEGIYEALVRCGLASLRADTPPDALHGGLVKLREQMRDWDSTRRAITLSVVTQRLKAAGLPNVTKIIKSAFPQIAPGPSPVGASTKPTKPTLVQAADPWPEPVDGVTVIMAVVAVITRYVVISLEQATAAALWVLHSYALDAFEHSPILAVLSPLKRCGKTTMLSVLMALTDRALLAANVTTAVLFRIIESQHPTLLLDEADTWLNDDKAELRGIVNSGWLRRGAVVLRVEGDEHDVKTFSTWTPKVIAAIGRIPDTIADRSLVLHLRRKTRAERVIELRSPDLDRATRDLRRHLRRWASDHLERLRDADPTIPEVLNDRAADSWRPLLAIADLIGGSWPEQARAAALTLSGPSDNDTGDESLPVQLLADIRQVFDSQDDPPVLDTTTMLKALTELPERPWAEYRHGKPLNGHALARLLRPFGIVSAGTIRIGGKTAKGYRRDAFVEAWNRYVPLPGGDEASQCNNVNESGPELPISKRHIDSGCDGLQSVTNPINTGDCYGVTVSTPENAPAQHFLTFEEET